ncbi:MAG: glycosyltransferase family 4 protein [Verrucomicrobia bacterium]|nr:glycosyltransferase family 4 protein [Verrucomicrobiota bacterium]
MNVLIVNSVTPFVRRGAEELADHLCEQLNATHLVRAEVLRIPFSWEPFEELPEQIFVHCALQLPNVDRVIALRFPAYLVPHPTRIIWLTGQCRRLDDLCGPGESDLLQMTRESRLREMIRLAESEAFSKCRRIFTASKANQERLKHYTGFDAEVLMPPLKNPELFADRGDGGYLFAGGRINVNNRQHLLVEALARTVSCPRLIVAGAPDTPEDANRLRETVRRLRLEDRVVLDFGLHAVTSIADYVNHAKACAYMPVGEDSVGYVAMEAAAASKPVITARDSGSTLRLVLNGETGCVTEPDAEDIARIIDFLVAKPARCREMGRAARCLWDSFKATWPATIDRLLS